MDALKPARLIIFVLQCIGLDLRVRYTSMGLLLAEADLTPLYLEIAFCI